MNNHDKTAGECNGNIEDYPGNQPHIAIAYGSEPCPLCVCLAKISTLEAALEEARTLKGLCADTKCGGCEGCKHRAAVVDLEEARKERDEALAAVRCWARDGIDPDNVLQLERERDTLRTEAKRLEAVADAARGVQLDAIYTQPRSATKGTADDLYTLRGAPLRDLRKALEALSPPTDPATTTDETKKP